MIHDFFPNLQKSELGEMCGRGIVWLDDATRLMQLFLVGRYAGFLASAYHLGSFLGNPVVCLRYLIN